MIIRVAVAQDVPAVAAIYAHEVAHGTATFDTSPPLDQTWADKVIDTAPGHHLLVADDAGVVLGFAYSVAYRPRGAYAATKETSVYLADAGRGRGLGRALYAELLRRLQLDGVHTAIAVIASPNPASVALHRASGFECVGVLREVGFKFGRRIDTEFWQLIVQPAAPGSSGLAQGAPASER